LYKPDDCLILIKLDIERIRLLKLEVTAETIAFSLLTSKLKIRPKDCQVSMLSIYISAGIFSNQFLSYIDLWSKFHPKPANKKCIYEL
jgi:hypothetical protein